MAYNLFAQQKQQNYPNTQTAQQVNPGQGNAGETPEQFAAGKQAANSQTAGYNAQPVQQTQQTAQATVTPTARPAATTTRAQATLPTIDPNSDTSGMDALSSMYTSPQDEERMRKASVANQRIMAVADALRHIGNIYNTVNYAPAQQLNSPVLEEQARYEKGKALRDKANLTYLNYQQAKAEQDRAMAKMAMDFKLKQADDARKERLNDARVSRYNSQNAKDGANKAYWETRARLLEEGYPLEKAIKEARKAQIEEQTRLTRIKANQGGFAPRRSGGGGSGAKYWDYDEDGNIHYYPNKTMWEQGVEEHSQNQDQNEQYPTGKKDWRGNAEQKTRKRTTVRKAGKNAYDAHNKNKRKTSGSGTNNSGFFN